jgi:hypothetical protein
MSFFIASLHGLEVVCCFRIALSLLVSSSPYTVHLAAVTRQPVLFAVFPQVPGTAKGGK